MVRENWWWLPLERNVLNDPDLKMIKAFFLCTLKIIPKYVLEWNGMVYHNKGELPQLTFLLIQLCISARVF